MQSHPCFSKQKDWNFGYKLKAKLLLQQHTKQAKPLLCLFKFLDVSPKN